MTNSVRETLRGVSDRDLLAAVRSGSVLLVSGVLFGSSYWERAAAIREEARRRGLL